MADESAAEAPAEAKKSGGILGKLVNATGILVLVIAGNIVTNIVVRDFAPGLGAGSAMSADAEGEGGTAAKTDAPKGPPIYLALDPPLVASVDDGQAIRFVQITVEVMAREQQTLDAVVTHTPVIRNNLLMLLGRKDILELTSSEGKEALRAEAVAEIRSILKKMGPLDPDLPLGELEDLYFTSFVVQ